MRRGTLVSAVLSVWVALILVLSLGAVAQAQLIRLPSGRLVSVLPAHGVLRPAGVRLPHLARPAVAGCDATTNSGLLTYGCGPVVQSSKPYLIFWSPSGTSIPSGSKTLLERYLTDTSTSGASAGDVFGVDRQYFDSRGYAGQSQSFSASSQAFVDTQAYPTTGNCTPNTKGFSACLTDSQVQTEINRVITAKGWPAGGTAANAPIYFMVLPQSVDQCFDSGSSICVDNYYCAYHDSFANGGARALYAVIPFAMLTIGKPCQGDGSSALQEPNGDPADVVMTSFSHEYNETVTDPVGGTGWYDSADGAEIGDLCAAFGPADPAFGTDPNAYLPVLGGSASAGTLYDQVINGDHYYTQTEWSNGAIDCEAKPGNTAGSPTRLTPVIAAPRAARTGSPVALSPDGSTVDAGLSSATWNFGDGRTAFASGSPGPVSHAYSAAGRFKVTLTLVDDQGNLRQTARTISVGSPRITSVASRVGRRARLLLVSVNEGGTVAAVGHSATLTGAGTVTFKLKLTHAELKRLRAGHPVKLHVKVVFTPDLGPVTTVHRTLKLER